MPFAKTVGLSYKYVLIDTMRLPLPALFCRDDVPALLAPRPPLKILYVIKIHIKHVKMAYVSHHMITNLLL